MLQSRVPTTILAALAGVSIYFALAAHQIAYVPPSPPMPAGKTVVRLWPPFEMLGHAAFARRQLAALGDVGDREDVEEDTRSPVVVYEDLQPLGPPHSNFGDISNLGAGRFTHWQRQGITFSASDNSDPNTNGRRYWAVVP
jgi:hypothetical protein